MRAMQIWGFRVSFLGAEGSGSIARCLHLPGAGVDPALYSLAASTLCLLEECASAPSPPPQVHQDHQ